MKTWHAIRFGDLACLCDHEAQCRACQGRGRNLPPGFDPDELHIETLDIVSRDPGEYVGRHRSEVSA